MSVDPKKSALIGFLLILPFFILNFVVVFRFEPVYSLMSHLNLLSSSPWFPTLLLLLFPIALFIVIRPMLNKDIEGVRKIYSLNLLFGTVILAVTVLIVGGLSQDIIACDILDIPNCD